MLALWQYDIHDRTAGKYINELYNLKDENKRKQILQALQILEMPLVETNGNQITKTFFFPNGQAMERIQGFMDSSGNFIRHGVWECWQSDGLKSLYGHFDNDELVADVRQDN